MSDRTLIRQCSPTMAGIKTGNLLMVDFAGREKIADEVAEFNRNNKGKGIAAVFLGVRNNRAIIYVFRPRLLARDLQDPSARELLFSTGYKGTSIGECIVHLRDRLSEGETFPHEIGLFLGYPPEDVRGFIENEGRNFKACGMWKVYSDENRASVLWARYKKCTSVYSRCYDNGTNIDRLTVAV
ncbi:MAG: DUF3793 family protein [Clostridiales bacterium]|nr:DUF3793 family protein [Clostridiales bacterium]